jgi:hypothetical protein
VIPQDPRFQKRREYARGENEKTGQGEEEMRCRGEKRRGGQVSGDIIPRQKPGSATVHQTNVLINETLFTYPANNTAIVVWHQCIFISEFNRTPTESIANIEEQMRTKIRLRNSDKPV